MNELYSRHSAMVALKRRDAISNLNTAPVHDTEPQAHQAARNADLVALHVVRAALG